MDALVLALGPALAAGFAVQQLLDLLDLLLTRLWSQSMAIKSFEVPDNKKLILGGVSLLLGFILTLGAGLRVLRPLEITNADFWDVIVTALIISAGSEGFNSILKTLGYVKDDRKNQMLMHKKALEADPALAATK